MDADAYERKLRTNIHESIGKLQAEQHVNFHVAAMYRDEAYRLSMQVAHLVAEREGLHCAERNEFLEDEANAAVERLNILQNFGTDQLERIYEKARTVRKAIREHNCRDEGGCDGKWIAELGWEKYIQEATEELEPEANRSREYWKCGS
jgi:hypothetical protein